MKNTPLTRDLLLELVDYDPEAGTLVWRERTTEMVKNIRSRNTFNGSYQGKPVGSTSSASHDIRVHLFGKTYSVRSLIYLIMTGDYPKGRTCTLNGIKDDLRWQNIATMADVKQAKKDGVLLANARNDSEINRTPYPGIVWSGQEGRFIAFFFIAFIKIVVGSYLTAKEAEEARSNRIMEMGI